MTPRARQAVVIGLSFLTVVVFALAVSAGLLYYFTHAVAAPSVNPLAEPQPPPPEPRLQVTPSADLARYQAEQDTRLNSFGWVDREQQIVHIPIDRAMDILLDKGLPAREPAGAERQQDTAR